jgi:eukaryotic-like serine/threonine-protein kinase
MPTEGDAERASSPERPRPGQISALLEQLVREPVTGAGGGWEIALRPGAVIGRFELVREVGRGGFGIVWEARDRELGRTVALKAIRSRARPEAAGDLLLREAEAAALCSHPNIVTLHDLGWSEHGPYLVLELLQGETLATRVARGPLGVSEALRVGVEVAKGLAHAHARGVIHRDLTPRNVFLCQDGQVKILDLGLAHAFGHRRLDGGTPGHMAPEQLRGAPEDERTDVYSLGVLLFEMLTGDVPSRHPGAIDVPALPALGATIARTLAEDPVERQRDAGELLTALSGLQRELERASAGHAARVVLKRPRRSRVRVGVAVAVGLVAVLGAAGALVLHARTTTPREITRVAVLPFTNLSGDQGQEYLGDGIAQEIAARLSTLVPVVAGSSVERFRRANPAPRTIGRELGVKFLIEGSVRRAGGHLAVNVLLVNTADSRQMWSDKIDVPVGEIPELPERVASQVVATLGLALSPEQQRALGSTSTRSAEAHDEYLQGEFAWNTASATNSEARVHYERALAMDPGYALAMARLAVLEISEYRIYGASTEHLDRAESLIRKALTINPRLAAARVAHSVLRMARWDYEGAAAEAAELARDEPLSVRAWRGPCGALGYVWPRRLQEAERACRRALELVPDDPETYIYLVAVLAYQGKLEEAERVRQRLNQVAPGMVSPGFVIAMESGRANDALAIIEAAHLGGSLYVAMHAAALARSGRTEEAFARLEAALDAGYRDAADLRNSAWYEPLRKDPRFDQLLARYGLGR